MIEFAPHHTWLDSRSTPQGIHPDPLHQGQVDHQPTVGEGVSDEVLSAAPHREGVPPLQPRRALRPARRRLPGSARSQQALSRRPRSRSCGCAPSSGRPAREAGLASVSEGDRGRQAKERSQRASWVLLDRGPAGSGGPWGAPPSHEQVQRFTALENPRSRRVPVPRKLSPEWYRLPIVAPPLRAGPRRTGPCTPRPVP